MYNLKRIWHIAWSVLTESKTKLHETSTTYIMRSYSIHRM